MTKSDAIFTGTVQDIGNEDSGDSYSFAYPAQHVVGMKIAIDQVSRGDVNLVIAEIIIRKNKTLKRPV